MINRYFIAALTSNALICNMDFINHLIQNYADSHTSEEPEHLKALNRHTHLHVLKPRMLSGHFQGRFLSMLSQLIRPTHVLDIGTFTGYSALCLAEGLSPEGCVYTIDNNEEVNVTAQKFIESSPYAHQISLKTGNADAVIPLLHETVDYWDIVWIDADKTAYKTYFDLCIDKVRKGGLIMADNVLWSGKVCDDNALKKDKDTQAIDEFNKYVSKDSRVTPVLLPIRDGIMMMIKN